MKKKQPYGMAGILAGLLAVGVALGGLGFWSWWTGEGLLPFERGALFFKTRVAAPVAKFFKGVDGLAEMGRLEAKAEELRARLAEMERVEMENARLRGALDFVGESAWRLVAARVVARGGGSGWWREVKLGKGSDAGIRVGDGVLTSAGLAGRVREVTPRTCVVMLLSDGNSRVGCELEGESEDGHPREPRRGVVVGGDGRLGDKGMRFVYGPDDLELRYVGGREEPAPGTRVVTSGLGGDLPRGILVGTVEHSGRAQGGVAFEAKVRPAANLRDLDIMFIQLRVEN